LQAGVSDASPFTAGEAEYHETGRMTALQFRQFLRRNAIWIVLVGVVCGAVAYAGVSGRPSYESTAKVILQEDDPATSAISTGFRQATDLQALATAQVPVVSSPAVLNGAARKAGLAPDTLRDHVAVTSDATSAVIHITSTADDAHQAQTSANAIAAAYVAYRGRSVAQQYESAARVVDRRLRQLLRDLASSRQSRDHGSQQATAERSAIRQQYSVAYGQRQTLEVQAAASTSDAQVISPAVLPGAPTRSPARFAVVGVVLGLLLGLVLTLVREQFDDRLRSLDDLPPDVRKQVFGEIPRVGRRHHADPRRHAEVIDALRAAWVHVRLTVPHETRVIVVTSAGSGEGKTFTARHLAESIADVSGRVVLVSGDLRHRTLDAEFGIQPGTPGLTTLLAAEAERGGGESDVGEMLVTVDSRGVRYLPSGPPIVRPSALLNSAVVKRVIDRLAHEADVIVIDTAPILPVPDTLGLVDVADLVFLVISLGVTSERSLRAAQAAVAPGAKAVGVLVDRVKSTGGYYSGTYAEPDERVAGSQHEQAPVPGQRSA
jgi:polysaccharide biosynthesis transport protein